MLKGCALLLALCSVGCAVEAKPAPLVKKGDIIAVLWGLSSPREQETLIVDSVRDDGWITGHNPPPQDPTVWLINLSRALELTALKALPVHPVIEEGPRERVSR